MESSYYKTISEDLGIEKYIQSNDRKCFVVVIGGLKPKISKVYQTYPNNTEEHLQPCEKELFYKKFIQAVRKLKAMDEQVEILYPII